MRISLLIAALLFLAAMICAIVAAASNSWSKSAPSSVIQGNVGLWNACFTGVSLPFLPLPLPASCQPLNTQNLNTLADLAGISRADVSTLNSWLQASRALIIIAAALAGIAAVVSLGLSCLGRRRPHRALLAIPLLAAILVIAAAVITASFWGAFNSLALTNDVSALLDFSPTTGFTLAIITAALSLLALPFLIYACARPTAAAAGAGAGAGAGVGGAGLGLGKRGAVAAAPLTGSAAVAAAAREAGRRRVTSLGAPLAPPSASAAPSAAVASPALYPATQYGYYGSSPRRGSTLAMLQQPGGPGGPGAAGGHGLPQMLWAPQPQPQPQPATAGPGPMV